jgi:hypothetical protein
MLSHHIFYTPLMAVIGIRQIANRLRTDIVSDLLTLAGCCQSTWRDFCYEKGFIRYQRACPVEC